MHPEPPQVTDPSKRSASDLIQWISSRTSNSSAIYVYDVAEQVGFGVLAKAWASAQPHSVPVIPLQTRAGAGLSLVGRLSEGSSQDAIDGSVLTAFTSPTGLAAMAPSLSYLPSPTSRSKLVIQVPVVTPTGDKFSLSSTLASVATTLGLLPDNITILLSATPQESVDFAALAYKLGTHVIHFFDHHCAAREMGHELVYHSTTENLSFGASDAFRQAGYTPFEFVGDENAHTVFIFLNGPLALAAKHLASRLQGVAVVIVKVLRPWNDVVLQEIVPSSAIEIYVFDDTPNDTTQGPLFIDVFSSLYDPLSPGRIIRSQRVVPEKTQLFQSHPCQFSTHLSKLVKDSSRPLEVETPPSFTKLLFLSTPSANLSFFHQLVADTFSRAASLRWVTGHDVLSTPGALTADRVVVGPKTDSQKFLPLSVIFPLDGSGKADFVCILDATVLKSHAVLDNAKAGSTIFLITSWSTTELLENLPPETLEVATQRMLRFYTIDAKPIVELVSDTTAHHFTLNLVVFLVFLRLYLGKSSNEHLVRKIAQGVASIPFSSDIFAKLNARTWLELVQVQLPLDPPAPTLEGKHTPATLKQLEFNAIGVDSCDGETVYNGSKVSSWHEGAKHILFPSAFTPPLPGVFEVDDFPQDPSLRPDVPERTFLVTCSVNRRLTPLEYDRNVFHLEFNTEGTGLKYAIGEALGVHGWNDEQDVLDFCAWYGVDPNRLITIPVPGGEGQMHTRTVFQALQQQIDLFGKPPKSFYMDLAPYAAESVDRMALQFIGSPEGSSTFKKLSEKDTVTFADVLQRYPSATPPIEKLCELIGDTKPRHYSIASSQSVVGNRVDLLVVTVEWTAPNGKCLTYRTDDNR